MSENKVKMIFRCPECGKSLGVSPEKAGASALCPNCGKRIVIPKEGKKKVKILAVCGSRRKNAMRHR